MLRLAIDTHIITIHYALPLLVVFQKWRCDSYGFDLEGVISIYIHI